MFDQLRPVDCSIRGCQMLDPSFFEC